MQRLLVWLLLASAILAAHRDPLADVNPLIGTQKSRIGYGGTMPFVSPPLLKSGESPAIARKALNYIAARKDASGT